jgi:hypothetical protein
MELTKNEIEIADRYISKRERQLAQWPHKRWLIIVIFSVIALLGYRTSIDGLRTIQNDRAADAQVDHAIGGPPPPGLEQRWITGSMMKISKILDLRYQEMTYAMLQVTLGYVEVLTALSMVTLTILRWNTGERDALICKLLRWKLQEFEHHNPILAVRAPAPAAVREPGQ